jgi:hypothetical protein
MTDSDHGGEMRFVKSIIPASLLLLVVAISMPVAAQSAPPRQFVSEVCGFRVKLPAGWRIKPSPSKKCTFTVIAPRRQADEGIDLLIRKGNLEQGSEDLGFTNSDGKWTLQGESIVEATSIESPSWVGVCGSDVATRIYKNGFYCCLGDQTRALLFDRKTRIAEITGYKADEVQEFMKGFEFLAQR